MGEDSSTRPITEAPDTETKFPTAGSPPGEDQGPALGREPTAWWIKLLVLLVVAALCLAFAGLVWALAF